MSGRKRNIQSYAYIPGHQAWWHSNTETISRTSAIQLSRMPNPDRQGPREGRAVGMDGSRSISFVLSKLFRRSMLEKLIAGHQAGWLPRRTRIWPTQRRSRLGTRPSPCRIVVHPCRRVLESFASMQADASGHASPTGCHSVQAA